MDRRKLLTLGGTIVSVAIAGCGNSSSSNEPREDTNPGATPADITATRTATPTPEPSSGGTDETPTPTPSPTPEPTPTPAQDGEQYSFGCKTDTVTDSFSIQGGFTSFDMAYDGESDFQVELIETSSGDTEQYLANDIGSWEGLLPYEIPAGEYVLDITADGAWEVIVRQPRHTLAEAERVPVMGEDDYPNYLGPIEFEGFHSVSGQYGGDSNFAVWMLDDSGREEDLLFDETGEFQGETIAGYKGLGYIRVAATGTWRVDIK